MVKFDTDTDSRFNDIDPHLQLAVLDCLRHIQDRNYSWADFVATHGWNPANLVGQDLAVGGIDLHTFYATDENSTYYVFNGCVILCCMASVVRPNQ